MGQFTILLYPASSFKYVQNASCYFSKLKLYSPIIGSNVCHTCPLTFNDSYNQFKVERKFEFILENARGRLAVAR